MKNNYPKTESENTQTEPIIQRPRRSRDWIFLSVILILAVFLLVTLVTERQSLTIKLNGAAENWIEYGEPYEDPWAQAVFSGRILKGPYDVDVRRTGDVDVHTLGTYTLTYRARFLIFSSRIRRIVHVQDTTAPVIELTMHEDAYTLPGDAYEEEGYTAFDSVDGDLTDKVERTEKDGVVTYTVTDNAGNRAVAERVINFTDPEPPQLVLLGGNAITVEPGKAYEDPGYIATDNLDGDLSDRVTVEGHVDPFVPGDYEIVYSVEDSWHNTASVTRTVTVDMIQQGPDDPDGRYIYLTFDDGPGPYTEQLLDILKKYNVKATFFVVNTGYTSLITREYEEGHSVGIHSATHDYHEIYASEEAYFNDLYKMDEIIYNRTGYHTNILRFPGGSSNTVSSFNPGIMTRLTQLVKEKGYQYFDWNVSSGDAGGTTSTDQVFLNVTNGVQDHTYSVVLMHDIKGFSVDAVERIIVWGLSNGYTFRSLDTGGPPAHHNINN